MGLQSTVVIPCFNGERYLGEAVASVVAQEGVELELIIVDDGSSDGSARIADEWAARDERITLVAQENAGVANARNAGLEASSAESEYVLFLDADDLLHRSAISRLIAELEQNPDLVAVAGTRSLIDAAGHQQEPAPAAFRPYRVAPSGEIARAESSASLDYWSLLPTCWITTPGQVLIRRSCIPSAVPFDQSVSPCEDWDLWLRLSRQGEIGLVDSEVVMYRHHAGGASKAYELMRRQRRVIYRRQAAVVAESERDRLRSAYLFGTYLWDAKLCSKWAREQMAAGQPTDAARLAARSVKFRLRFWYAVLRREANDL